MILRLFLIASFVSILAPAIPAQSFSRILDTPGRLYVADEFDSWLEDKTEFVEGGASIRSNPDSAATNPSPELATTVQGPATLSFWWRRETSPGTGFEVTVNEGVAFESSSTGLAWEQVTLRIPPGTNLVEWNASIASDVTTWIDNVVVTPEPGFVVAEVLDAPALSFYTGPPVDWDIDTTDSVFGGSSLVSTYVGVGGTGGDFIVSVSVQGPGTLEFSWKTTSTHTINAAMKHNGYEAAIPPVLSVGWQRLKIPLRNGANTIAWEMDGALNNNQTWRVWLDHIVYTPGPATLIREALDCPELRPDPDNPNLWSVDFVNSVEGGSSLVSSPGASDRAATRIELPVRGPAAVRFSWKSNIDAADLYRCLLNDSSPNSQEWGIAAQITGVTDWREEVVHLSPGDNLVTWYYYAAHAPAVDKLVWLDDISVEPRVEAEFEIPEVLDRPSFTVWAEDRRRWDHDTTLFAEGDASLRSIAPLSVDDTMIVAQVQGPSILRYHWKAPIERIGLYVDDTLQFRSPIGLSSLVPVGVILTPGPHRVEWRIDRTSSDPLGHLNHLDGFSTQPVDTSPQGLSPSLSVALNASLFNQSATSVRWDYIWSSTSPGDPVLSRPQGTELIDTVIAGESGATFDPGETWTVVVQGYDVGGAPTPDRSQRTFQINSTASVAFGGWTE